MKRTLHLFPILLIFLVCLISFRFIFFASYVHMQKAEFRRQLITSKVKDVIRFEFAEGDLFRDKQGFEWKENNKELVVNGIYHEVIRVSVKNGKALVFVIPDKAESNLFLKFFALNKHLQGNGQELIKHLLSLTYIPSCFTVELKDVSIEVKQAIPETAFNTSSFILETIKPPELPFV